MESLSHESLRRAALQQLESLQRAGVLQLPRASNEMRSVVARAFRQSTDQSAAASLETANDVSERSVTSTAPSHSPADSAPSSRIAATGPDLFAKDEPPVHSISTAATLDILQREVAGCTLCPELASTRTQTVFGVGNPSSRLCFLGEAPGADEDRQGEPFVGRAGQLLNKILQACRLEREEVYILNVLKCRPPGNRNPAPEEAGNCRRYLDRQLQLIEPRFICCLGAVAAQNLLSTTQSIGKLRGAVHDYRGIGVVCTYHPAYLLRNPSAKKYAWEDMKLLMRELGDPVD